VTVDKDHLMFTGTKDTPFRMSQYAQYIGCMIGQSCPFDDGELLLEKLSGMRITSKQLERLCHYYGSQLEEEIFKKEEASSTKDQSLHYAMFDGSMLLTREDKWREIKLSRIFSADKRLTINKKRGHIHKSIFISHLGNHQDFFKKVMNVLDQFPNLVCVADGAKWIWDVISDFYPNAVQILDFYHACEYLHEFSKLYFEDVSQGKKWLSENKALLINGKVNIIIEHLEELEPTTINQQEARLKILTYYTNNIHRMKYDQYYEKGYMIGSGAIESAHRHVIQQRLKLSGQRWTIAGAQAVSTLRCIFKSDQESTLFNLITRKAA
jgi:hypothetical protein